MSKIYDRWEPVRIGGVSLWRCAHCCVLPQTEHLRPIEAGAVGRQGMSVERTFPPVSRPEDLQAWVRPLPYISALWLSCKKMA